MPLFKFIERQYMDLFFQAGVMRLGTAADYKDTVQHGLSRGDEKEGTNWIRRGFGETAEWFNGEKEEPLVGSSSFRVEPNIHNGGP